jgi:hypothetical protein
MKMKSRIAPLVPQAESPVRHLPLVDLLVETRTELLELALRSGLKVFTAMLGEDRTAICGPRYTRDPDRPASRAGTTRSEVVLGGRKVAIQRPRVRTASGEVALPTFQAMAAADPLDRRVVEQMLVGVATRQYARSLEPLGPEMKSRGTSKNAVSRRFVVRTTAARGLAERTARWPRSRSVAGRRRAPRGSLPHRRVGDRCRRPETRPRPVGRLDRERDRVPGAARQSPESGPPHRPQPARDPRWLEGAPQGRARDFRRGGPRPAVSGPQDPQHPRVSQ